MSEETVYGEDHRIHPVLMSEETVYGEAHRIHPIMYQY